jgi:hypothetical protein
MAHSVIITTPRLTLDELGEQYGLTRAEQDFLIRLVDEKGLKRRVDRASKPKSTRAKTAKAPAKKAPAKKAV